MHLYAKEKVDMLMKEKPYKKYMKRRESHEFNKRYMSLYIYSFIFTWKKMAKRARIQKYMTIHVILFIYAISMAFFRHIYKNWKWVV